jgi:hypothetical protein
MDSSDKTSEMEESSSFETAAPPSSVPEPWTDLSRPAVAALLFWVERKIKSKIPDAEFGTMLTWLSLFSA